MAERKKARVMKTAKEIRAMTPKDRLDALEKLKEELMHEKGIGAMGGALTSPGKIRQLRRSVARFYTIIGELERAEAARKAEKPKKPKVAKKEPAEKKEKPVKKAKAAKKEKKEE